MQPTYLPWLGYFDMIDQSDCFVFLDSVQFSKRSWQQRNRIKGHDRVLWLTVPVLTSGRGSQQICEVEIAPDSKFREEHLKSISHSYHRASFFDDYIDGMKGILRRSHRYLADLNIELINWLCSEMGIEKRLLRSSELYSRTGRVDRLVSICEAVGAQRYLAARGSQDYLSKSEAFETRGVRVSYHDYSHPTYRQLYGDFVPFLSAVDLLFNEGPNSLDVIRQGRAM